MLLQYLNKFLILKDVIYDIDDIIYSIFYSIERNNLCGKKVIKVSYMI